MTEEQEADKTEPLACSQCGRPAVFVFAGHPLCIDCNLKRVQAFETTHRINTETMNWLLGLMEQRVGLPGILPRFQNPQPVIRQEGPVTFNNIRVDRSVVGTINTGNVKRLDVMLNQTKAAGAGALADAVAALTEALLQSQALDNKRKDEAVEQIAFLVDQAALPKEKRQPGVIRATLTTLKDTVTTVGGLAALWEQVRLYFEPLLGQ